MAIVRKVGAAVLLVAAVWVWFNLSPAVQPDHRGARSSINAEDDLNNANTEGAPQQAVVNGWTNLQYEELISKQLDTNASAGLRDDRPPAMLGLCVAGIALIALTTPGPMTVSPGASSSPRPRDPDPASIAI